MTDWRETAVNAEPQRHRGLVLAIERVPQSGSERGLVVLALIHESRAAGVVPENFIGKVQAMLVTTMPIVLVRLVTRGLFRKALETVALRAMSLTEIMERMASRKPRAAPQEKAADGEDGECRRGKHHKPRQIQ